MLVIIGNCKAVQSTHAMAQAGADSQNLGPANDGPGEQLRVLGRGRGRGKRRVDGSDVHGLGMHEFQQEVVGTYDTKMYEAVMRGDTEAVKEALLERTVKKDGEVPSFFSDYEAVMSSTNPVSESPVTLLPSPAVRPAPKKAATKTNGYCLFIKHMGRETDTVGSINELMAKFDKDWKVCDSYYFTVFTVI